MDEVEQRWGKNYKGQEVMCLTLCLAIRKAFGRGLLLDILSDMIRRGIPLNTKVYGAVLRELGQMEKWGECLEVSVLGE